MSNFTFWADMPNVSQRNLLLNHHPIGLSPSTTVAYYNTISSNRLQPLNSVEPHCPHPWVEFRNSIDRMKHALPSIHHILLGELSLVSYDWRLKTEGLRLEIQGTLSIHTRTRKNTHAKWKVQNTSNHKHQKGVLVEGMYQGMDAWIIWWMYRYHCLCVSVCLHVYESTCLWVSALRLYVYV